MSVPRECELHSTDGSDGSPHIYPASSFSVLGVAMVLDYGSAHNTINRQGRALWWRLRRGGGWLARLGRRPRASSARLRCAVGEGLGGWGYGGAEGGFCRERAARAMAAPRAAARSCSAGVVSDQVKGGNLVGEEFYGEKSCAGCDYGRSRSSQKLAGGGRVRSAGYGCQDGARVRGAVGGGGCGVLLQGAGKGYTRRASSTSLASAPLRSE